MTAAALASENKALAHPSSVDSIPTSANQKTTFPWRRPPVVACGAWRTTCAAFWRLNGWLPGLDFRNGLKTSEGLEQARRLLREHVSFYDKDRFFAPDIEAASQLLAAGHLTSLLPAALLPSRA